MKQLFYVDRARCGSEDLPPDFDLEDFCEVLQGKLRDVEIVPLSEPDEQATNRDPSLVSDAVFNEALGEYCHR